MAKASDSPASPTTPASFEAALTELETLAKTMEQTDTLALEASLAAYQRGMELLRYCQETLQNAEQKVQILEGDTLRDFTPSRDV